MSSNALRSRYWDIEILATHVNRVCFTETLESIYNMFKGLHDCGRIQYITYVYSDSDKAYHCYVVFPIYMYGGGIRKLHTLFEGAVMYPLHGAQDFFRDKIIRMAMDSCTSVTEIGFVSAPLPSDDDAFTPLYTSLVGDVNTRFKRVQPEVLLLIGPDGSGKTTWIKNHLKKSFVDHYYANSDEQATMNAYWKDTNSRYWKGYQGESIVVMDDYEGCLPYVELKRLLSADAYNARLNYKHNIYVHPTKIIISTNMLPTHWYKSRRGRLKDIYDHLTKIYHFRLVNTELEEIPEPDEYIAWEAFKVAHKKKLNATV